MEPKAKALVVGGVLVVTMFVGRAIMNANGPSDAEQIQVALDQSIEASREGRPGGVMDKLSAKFKVNNEIPASFRQIAQFIKDSRPDITVAPAKPVVAGDEGRMITSVRFKADLGGTPMEQNFERVTLVFRRESARDWLVLPKSKWRLAEVETDGFNPSEFAQ